MTCTSSCLQDFPHVFTEGDRLPEIVGVLDGVDLSPYTIEFTLLRPDGSVVEKSSATSGVVITDPPNGQFKVTWEATDLVEGSRQLAQIRFIDGSGLPFTTQDFYIGVKEKQGT